MRKRAERSQAVVQVSAPFTVSHSFSVTEGKICTNDDEKTWAVCAVPGCDYVTKKVGCYEEAGVIFDMLSHGSECHQEHGATENEDIFHD